jgi:predicted ester cyclase
MDTTGAARANAEPGAVMRRWFDEVWNQGKAEVIDELFPEHAVMWGVGRPEARSQGPGEFKEFYKALRSACPDVKITLDQVVQEGDVAVGRWTARMTHTGEGLGMAPTNQVITLKGTSGCRVQGEAFVEGWNVWDQLGLVRQLGLLQGPAAEMFR